MRFGLQLLLLLIFITAVLLVLSILWQRRSVRRRRLRLPAPMVDGALPIDTTPLAVAPLEDWRSHPERIGEERGGNEQLLAVYESETSVLKWLQELLLTELGQAGFGVVTVADPRADQSQPVVSGEVVQLLIRPDRREVTVTLALRLTQDGLILHRRRYEQVRPVTGRLMTAQRWAGVLGDVVRDVCAAFADDALRVLSAGDRDEPL